MAEIHIEKKRSIWPWIIGALILALLIWALVEMFDRDEGEDAVVAPTVTEEPAVVAPVAGATAATDTTAATGAGVDSAAQPADAGMARYAGLFVSDTMELTLNADGSYTMRESPAGEGSGRWTVDASANALHLMPSDGTPDRYFRITGLDTLNPLNPQGEPVAQMAPLQRREAR